MRILVLLSIIAHAFLSPHLKANTVIQNLFINRGLLTTVKGSTFPFLAFNSTSTFTALNTVITCLKNDTLILNIANNDSVAHGFRIRNYPSISYTINPSASVNCTFIPTQRSLLVYYDHLAYPRNFYMGLAGMIAVKNQPTDKVYYWNIKEHQASFNQALGYGVSWPTYYPDFFTINSKSYAALQNDATAKIQQNVGDTIYIYTMNTGQSMHSLHFHGFHATAVFADSKFIRQYWEKDTWGMFPMDALVLRMVPDKAGRYSVHDHNLVAVTGGNTHPNGMFTIMEISP